MIILDSVSKSLEVKLTGIITTNELNFVCSFVDITPITFLPIEFSGLTSGTSPVTVMASPVAGTQRQLKFLSVFNDDTNTATVIIQLNDSSTTRTVSNFQLEPNYTLIYNLDSGFNVLDASGFTISTGIDGASGYSGFSGAGGSGFSGFSGSGFSGFSGYSGAGTSGFSGYSGFSGTSAYSGFSGFSGFSGSGFSGYSGYSGINGSSSSLFLYDADATHTSGNPGIHQLLWNNLTQISATQINVNHLTSDGLDIDIFLSLIAPTQRFTIQDANDSANYQTWLVTGTPVNVISVTSYWEIPCIIISSGGTGTTNFPNTHQLYFAIVSAVSGYSGFSAYSGYSGFSGTSAFSGFSGFSGQDGISGFSGFSGQDGVSGFSGYSGNDGVSGFSGFSGFSGKSAYSGYSGKSAYSGYSGKSAYSGYSGKSAYSGYSGIDGASGYSGYSGTSAYSGFSGYSGTSAYSGYSGYSGSGFSGYSGYSGSGYSGYSGYSGGAIISGPLDSSLTVFPTNWYDFTDVSTLFVNDDGSGGNPTNGVAFGLCQDKSGNGFDLYMNASGQKPIYSTGLLNSYSGATFDGTDDQLQTFGATQPTRPSTIFVIFSQITNVSGKRLFDGYYLNTGCAYQDGSHELSIYAGAVGASSQGFTVGTFGIGIFQIQADSSFIESTNGAKTGSIAAQSQDMIGFTLGGCGVGSSGLWSNVSVIEVLCYNQVLPIVQRKKIIDYYSNRYSI